MTKSTGGPAFPNPEIRGPDGSGIVEGWNGMTLRDYAAIEALNGMLAHSKRYKPREGSPANWHEAIAQEAYQLADAMIAERDKP